MICSKSDFDSKSKTISILKTGGIVILPTDTVYGFSGIASPALSGDISELDASKKIRRIKGREETKPFIQLISTPEEIKNYTDDYIPQKLLEYWPGPLTIIVNDNRVKKISDGNGGATTAFRCPGDEWLRLIIGECGCPIYSTSVNRSGKAVLTKESEIISEFENEVDLIVLDGDSKDAIPSTIVSVADGRIKVVRQGKIAIDEDLLNQKEI